MNIAPLRAVVAVFSNTVVATAIILLYLSYVTFWYDSYQSNVVVSTLFLAAILAAAALYFLSAPIKGSIFFLKNRYSIWCLSVLVIQSLNVWRLKSQGTAPEFVEPIFEGILYFLLAPAFLYLVFRIPKYFFKWPLFIIAILAPSVLVYDFAFPGTMHPAGDETNVVTSARISGFWLNPNFASEAIVLILVLCSMYFQRKAMMFFYVLAIFGIVLTASRAGMIAYLLIGISFYLSNTLPRYFIFFPVLISLTFGFLLSTLEDAAFSVGRNTGVDAVIKRIEFIGGKHHEDFSTESRSEIAASAFQQIFETPFIGHGTKFIDTVFNVGSHNMILDWTYQYGIVGFILWATLAYLLWKVSSKSIFLNLPLIVFVWFSFFSHNMLDSNIWFIFLAFVFVHSDKAASPINAPNFTITKRKKRRRKRRKHSIPSTSRTTA